MSEAAVERERGQLPKARWALAALGVLAWLGGCLDSTAPPPTVATLTVAPFTATIAVGDTLRLTATLRDPAGVAIRGLPVAWASGAPDVATVSPTGLVTGVADGLVTITAASDGMHGRALVTVGGPPPPAPQLVASNAVSPPQGTLPAAGPRGVTALIGDVGDSIAFVSLSPGAAPSGVIATVHSPAASQSLTAVISNGGFDPVAIGARPGDSIRVVVRDGQGVVLLQAQIMVAAARPPIVVRTDPPPRKRDVPLNAAIVIVFSEPMDQATLTASSVLLLQGSTAVAGAARLLDAAGLTGVFEPSGPLAPNTDYRLVVTSAVRDLSGSALEAPVASDFTTGDAVAGGAASLTVSPSLIEGFYPATTLIRAYVRDAQGNVLVGPAVQWTSSDSSTATVTPSGGAASQASGSEAWLTLRAGGVATITATSGGLSDTAVVRSYPLPPGSVRVTAATTGADLDPNGYLVQVLGNGQLVSTNGALTYPSIPVGEHAVELRDVASNCTITGANPQTVTVTSDDTVDVAFAVTCSGGLPSLRVTIATTGVDFDANGYLLDVLGWAFGQVPVNGAVTFSGMSPGERSVELRDVAPNCTVSEANPRAVTIVRGASAEVAFTAACSARPPGTLQVTVATLGADLDPDGYTVSLDGGAPQPVAVNGAVTFADVPAGEHTVALGDLASNCFAVGGPSALVTIVQDSSAQVAFEVACVANAGSLRVTVVTTGADLDPNGYLVEVLGNGQVVPTNGSYTYPALRAGEHAIELRDVASNCAVSEPTPQTVSIVEGDTAEVAFAVTCSGGLPSLRVTIATTGASFDANGYLLDVIAWAFGNVPVNGAVTFSGMSPGERSVELRDVAQNCAVSGANPQTVGIVRGATVEVAFAVACTALAGTLQLTTATTGADLDPDGYDVSIDGIPRFMIGANATVSTGASDLTTGDHTIGLGGVAPNCVVDGANPRAVTFAPHADVAFAVVCSAPAGGTVVSVTVVPESALVVVGGYWGYRADVRDAAGNLVGAPVTWTTSDPGVATVSATGRATGVARGRATITATSDGRSGAAVLSVVTPIVVTTATTGVDLDLDGYYVSLDGSGPGAPEFYIGPRDSLSVSSGGGGHLVGLVGVASNCTVSGENPRLVVVTSDEDPRVAFELVCAGVGKIAFVSEYQDCVACDESSPFTTAITVMNEDGSNPVVVAADGAAEPAWSPDGARIAFARGDIWVMGAAGGVPTNLTNDAAWDGSPTWSPDGSRIAFASNRDGQPELYVMNADGSGAVRLTNTVGFVGRPAWSPEGSKIAFNCRVEPDNPDVCALSSDGMGFVRLTSEPGWDHSPAWSPDGSTIAFATGRYGGAIELALMHPDGSGVRRVGAGTAGDEPAWSPDGIRLAFSWAPDPEPCYSFAGCRTYYVAAVNSDGSGLIPALAAGYSPAWRPRLPQQVRFVTRPR